MKHTHLNYFSAIVLLMILTLVLASVLILPIGKLNPIITLCLIIIYSLFAGYISAKTIEKITHKDKREILAGSLIPLPATICLILYIVVLNNLKFIETVDPVWASAAFFISFNIPFLVIIYEHERHKHHLVGLTLTPLALAVVYLFAYFLTSYIATDFISPQVIDSVTLSYEVAPVKNYVENCMKSVAQEAVEKEQDVKSYLDANLETCIDSFSAFEHLDIKTEDFSSEVIYGETTLTVKLHYPVSFTEGNFNYKISDFQTIIER
ncbi:hypothetical protein KY345_04475 [Candidatus Woesearchaeota archaeon]|nr:hypothetical protein [Candidatus Woesearchaeota archaeon]